MNSEKLSPPIWICQNDEELGPFTRNQVFALLRDGTVSEEDPAKLESDTGWRSVREVLKAGGAALFSVEAIGQVAAQTLPAENQCQAESNASQESEEPGFGEELDDDSTMSRGRRFALAYLVLSVIGISFAGWQLWSLIAETENIPTSTKTVGRSVPQVSETKSIESAFGFNQFAAKPTDKFQPPEADLTILKEQAPTAMLAERRENASPISAGEGPKKPTSEVLVVEAKVATQSTQPNELASSMGAMASSPDVTLANQRAEITKAPTDGQPTPQAPAGVANAKPVAEPIPQPSVHAVPFVPVAIKHVPLPSRGDVTNADFWIAETCPKPRAIFALCVGANEKASLIIKDQAWQKFAHENGLLFIAVGFQSDRKVLAAGRGFVKAEYGSGDLFLKGLEKGGVPEAPLLITGRSEGGDFCSSFVGWKPDGAVLWAAYSNSLSADSRLLRASAPGLIVCDLEMIRRANCKAQELFENARGQGKAWSFVSLPGNLQHRQARVEEFIRQYVSAALKSKIRVEDGAWVGLHQDRELTQSERLGSPREAIWLPSNELVPAWSDLCQTRSDNLPTIVKRSMETRSASQRNLHLFLRLPAASGGDGKKVNGVIAFCTWEADQNAIVGKLSFQPGDALLNLSGPEALAARVIKFAEEKNLAVLTWGTVQSWNVHENTNDLAQKAERKYDHNFDLLATAWERGVKDLARETGIPTDGYLLYGISRGAQWAHRLALRRPDYFLAVHAHIPSSFDIPTPEAKKVLWLITTGELEGGYERAKTFYSECRQQGYPIMFKAIVGLRHSSSPIADELGRNFFEYALSLRIERERYDEQMKSALARAKTTDGPWLEAFRAPPFFGDMVNQDCVRSDQVAMVPAGFRVPLPTETLAKVWNK